MNWQQRNDGKDFEKEFNAVSKQYRFQKILALEKCDPPTRIVRGQIIYQQNPFLDWVGSWTERGGRSLFIETKSTSEPKLILGGKLTEDQKNALIRWHRYGAAVGVCWQWIGHGTAFLPVGQVVSVWDTGRRHIKWEEVEPLPQGIGFVTFDFVLALRRWYPAGNEPDAGQLAARTGRADG